MTGTWADCHQWLFHSGGGGGEGLSLAVVFVWSSSLTTSTRITDRHSMPYTLPSFPSDSPPPSSRPQYNSHTSAGQLHREPGRRGFAIALYKRRETRMSSGCRTWGISYRIISEQGPRLLPHMICGGGEYARRVSIYPGNKFALLTTPRDFVRMDHLSDNPPSHWIPSQVLV